MNFVKHRECLRLVAVICAIAIVPGDVRLIAQAPAPSAGATPPEAKKTPDQLDSLVAPIALYPDPLLAQVLAASTYPLEIVQCARWFKENPKLKGEEACRLILRCGRASILLLQKRNAGPTPPNARSQNEVESDERDTQHPKLHRLTRFLREFAAE